MGFGSVVIYRIFFGIVHVGTHCRRVRGHSACIATMTRRSDLTKSRNCELVRFHISSLPQEWSLWLALSLRCSPNVDRVRCPGITVAVPRSIRAIGESGDEVPVLVLATRQGNRVNDVFVRFPNCDS